jgi:hypothetical protein
LEIIIGIILLEFFIYFFNEGKGKIKMKMEGILESDSLHLGHSCIYPYFNLYFITNYFPTLIRFGVSIYCDFKKISGMANVNKT